MDEMNMHRGLPIHIIRVTPDHHSLVNTFLQELSALSRSRFAPHGDTAGDLAAFYGNPAHEGWIAVDGTGRVAGYAVLYLGVVPHDRPRYTGYGFRMDERIDLSFAPSVGEAWQGMGLAQAMWMELHQFAHARGYRRIFLWGGVQSANPRAIRFYEKLGFRRLGQFVHGGENLDMVHLG